MIDKRNPNLIRGIGETTESYGTRIAEYIQKLEWQSEGHRQWYTHKNPYGCWICELLQIGGLFRDSLMVQGQPIDRDGYDSNHDRQSYPISRDETNRTEYNINDEPESSNGQES